MNVYLARFAIIKPRSRVAVVWFITIRTIVFDASVRVRIPIAFRRQTYHATSSSAIMFSVAATRGGDRGSFLSQDWTFPGPCWGHSPCFFHCLLPQIGLPPWAITRVLPCLQCLGLLLRSELQQVAQLWQRDRAKLDTFSINLQRYSQNNAQKLDFRATLWGHRGQY